MKEDDKSQFAALMKRTIDYYQRETSSEVLGIYWGLLKQFDIKSIARAIEQHMLDPRQGQFMPKVADLMRHLPTGERWPGADEAWAMMPKCESDSGTVCQEMMEAWAVARSIWVEGDKVGARMAFREAYQRLVERATSEGRAVKWWPSLGHDAEGRSLEVSRAVDAGLLTHEFASSALLDYRQHQSSEVGRSQLAMIKQMLRSKMRH